MEHIILYENFDDLLGDLEDLGFVPEFKYGKDFGIGPELKGQASISEGNDLYFTKDMISSLQRLGVLDEPVDKQEQIYSIHPRMYINPKIWAVDGIFGGIRPSGDGKTFVLTVRKSPSSQINLDLAKPSIITSFILNLEKKAKSMGTFKILIDR